MFIPLKMLLIGIDPYPFIDFLNVWGHKGGYFCGKNFPFCSTDWRSCYRLEGILGVVTSSITAAPNAPDTTRSMTRAISNAWHTMQAGRAKNDISTVPQFIFRLRNSWLKNKDGGVTQISWLMVGDGEPQHEPVYDCLVDAALYFSQRFWFVGVCFLGS